MKRLLPLLGVLIAATSHGQTAATKITEGRAALAAHNVTTAQLRFQEALDLSPTSQTAGALLGITRLFALGGETSSTAFFGSLGMTGTGNFYNWAGVFPADAEDNPVFPPNYNLTSVEAYWQGTLIPTWTAARGNLAVVTDPSFLLTLTAAELDASAGVTIDRGDVLMVRACLSALEFVFQFLSSQDLRANAAAINQLAQGDLATFRRILADNPDLLKAGNPGKRAAARAALIDMITVYRQGSDFLRQRPPGVDRLFMLESDDFEAEADFRDSLAELELSLTAPVSTNDEDGAMFLGPVFGATWSIRDYLPLVSAPGFALASIPDPTLGGVASGASREELAEIFGGAGMGWVWENASATVSANVPPGATVQWQRNGNTVTGANAASLSLSAVYPADAGIYSAVVTSGSTVTNQPFVVGVTSAAKVMGTGNELLPVDIPHPNKNIFDQVLLNGAAATITADPGQATRLSFIDLSNDIVQVEFSGAGTLSIVLENPSGPAAPVNYNQAVNYMKGHAGIVITGADETTNVGVFSVGRATAFDPTGTYNILQAPSATNVPANNGSSLFAGRGSTTYDGTADIAFIAIASANGSFGGLRTANVSYSGTKSLTGIYAPNVFFQGPLFVGNISAFDAATPVLMIGWAFDTRITGGDLFQPNGRDVLVSGLSQLKFTAGLSSHGTPLSAKANRAVLRENGQNVTSFIVVNP